MIRIAWTLPLLVALAFACGGDDDDVPSTPTPPPPTFDPRVVTPAPTQVDPATYAQGTLVGVAAVDHFLELFYKDDLAALAAEAVFKDVPCIPSSRAGTGDVACEPGMPEGARRSVFPMSSCAISFVTFRQQFVDRLRDRNAVAGRGALYAVYEAGPSSPEAAYVVLVRQGNLPHDGQYRLDSSGRLLAISACGRATHLPEPGAKVILAPKGG